MSTRRNFACIPPGARALVRRNFLEPMWEDLRATKRLVINEWKAESILPGKDWVTKYSAPILAELKEVRVVTGAGGVALMVLRD